MRRRNQVQMRTRGVHTSVIRIALFCVISLSANTAFGQGVVGEVPSDRWRSSVFFYIWGANLDGTASVAGNEVDIGGGNLAEHIGGIFSGHFESRKGKWGYFLDGMYVRLDPDADTPVGRISADVTNVIVEAAGVYQFNPTIKGLLGIRYQDLDVDLDLSSGNISGNKDWVDGFIGLRLIPVQTDKWRVWLRGDVGVVGDSDTTWHAVLGAGYRFNPAWSLVAAYRVLSNDIEDGGFKWDVVHSGLGLAVGYTF